MSDKVELWIDDMLDGIKFTIGNDGMPYAYWPPTFWPYAWEYAEMLFGDGHSNIANCGGYENGVLLQDTIGM